MQWFEVAFAGGRVFALSICFFAAACQDPQHLFNSKDGGGVKPLSEPASSYAAGGYDVRVEPVDGTSRPMAMLLANSVVDSLAEKEVSATVNSLAKSRYVLRGKAEPNWSGKPASFIAVIRWTLFDGQNNVAGEYAHGVRGEWPEWENGDPRIIRSVGQDAAQPFAGMIRKNDEPLPPAFLRDTGLRGIGLMVKKVNGAPGDGDGALTAAIKEALSLADVSVTEDPRQADYVLQGEVKLLPASQGQQLAQVKWTLFTPAGTEAGAAIQENSVPEGALEGAWGKTATEVAAAAIGGIEDVLAQAANLRTGKDGKTDEDKIRTRKNLALPPDLPQMPGKAPPPPM